MVEVIGRHESFNKMPESVTFYETDMRGHFHYPIKVFHHLKNATWEMEGGNKINILSYFSLTPRHLCNTVFAKFETYSF